MKRYANVSRINYGQKRASNKINWEKQAVYGPVYPGRIFYDNITVFHRENYGNVFDQLSTSQIQSLMQEVRVGDQIQLLDTGDQYMVRYLRDIMQVERVSDDGKVSGKLMYAGIIIDFLPQMDLLMNLNNGGKKLNYIRFIKERERYL